MASNNVIPPDNSNKTIYTDITIGVIVIIVGAIIYIGRLLYKRRKRKRKDLEKVLEPIVELEEIDIKPSPKKTAADHLGELKEATQKVLQPLRKSSTFSSPKDSSLNLSNLSSARSSSSSSRARLYDKIPFNFKLFRVPPPPPPTPLSTDDIKVDPIRMSLLTSLLNDDSENTSLMSFPVIPSDLSRGTSTISLPQLTSKSQPNLNLFTETNSKKDLSRKASHPNLHLMNSKKDLSRKASNPDLNLMNSKKDLSRKISHPDLNLTNSKNLTRKSSHPDLNPTNLKKDLYQKMSKSQSDLNLLTAMSHLDLTPSHSKRDLLPQLGSSEIRDLSIASRSVPTVPQLDSTIPSEKPLKREITQTKPKSNSKVRSRRSHRRKHSHSRKKETNDYTNFQPIQNIKPIQNARSEKRTMAAKITKIVETEEVGESPPMYSVKPFSKESQDDEIILDATFGMKSYANK